MARQIKFFDDKYCEDERHENRCDFCGFCGRCDFYGDFRGANSRHRWYRSPMCIKDYDTKSSFDEKEMKMGRFLLMAVGQNYEEMLAPYNEDERRIHDITGLMDSLSASAKKMGKSLEEYLEFNDFTAVPLDDYDGVYERKSYGYSWYTHKDGIIIGLYQWTNPEAKYDSWTVGGAWRDDFRFHDGCIHEASRKKKDYDGAAMVRNGVMRLFDRWDMVQKIIKGRNWETRDELGKRISDDKTLHKEFYAQDVVRDAIKSGDSYAIYRLESVGHDTREEHFDKQLLGLPIRNILDKDGWHDQKDSKWLGLDDSAPCSEAMWFSKARQYFNSLDDDELITFIDCHM